MSKAIKPQQVSANKAKASRVQKGLVNVGEELKAQSKGSMEKLKEKRRKEALAKVPAALEAITTVSAQMENTYGLFTKQVNHAVKICKEAGMDEEDIRKAVKEAIKGSKVSRQLINRVLKKAIGGETPTEAKAGKVVGFATKELTAKSIFAKLMTKFDGDVNKIIAFTEELFSLCDEAVEEGEEGEDGEDGEDGEE
jgi:hypothetical protein